MTWLRGEATQSTIADKLVKLIAGEVADDFAVTAAVGDRWVRPVAGQDFLHAPASMKVTLPNMSMRTGYFQPGNNRRANDTNGLNGNWFRMSSISTSSPATRWLVAVGVQVANTLAGDYSNATIRYMAINADTGAALVTPTTVTPNAAGQITLPAGAGGGQVTVGNSATGILAADTTAAGTWGGAHYRQFDGTYLGGIDFWPLEYRRYTGETSTFSVAPPGAAGTDYDKDVRIPCGFDTAIQNGSRPAFMHLSGGYGFGLGIKTTTALTGALYTVTWNVYAMGVHLSLQGTQYLQAELNGGRGLYPATATYRRVQGTRHVTWLRLFTGTPVAASTVQYWVSVKADRILIVLNSDPAVGGVFTCAGIWKFTPSDATNDRFPWAYTGNVINYQFDNPNADAALAPTRAWPLIAQQAAANGYGLPASRDWATGWMRTDVACSTHNGNTQLTTTGTGWFTDNDGGTEGGNDSSGLAMGGFLPSNGLAGGTRPYMVVPGGYGDQAVTPDRVHGYPTDEQKPWPGDSKWWLYGHVYYDSPSYQGVTSNEGQHYRGKLDDKLFWLPSQGWASGDELTDTGTGKVYFLVAADFAGGGMGRVRIATNSYRGGVAVEEA